MSRLAELGHFAGASKTSHATSEVGRALLQERVASFALVLGGIYGFASLADLAALFMDDNLGPSELAGWSFGFIILGLGFWMRRGTRSATMSRRVDELVVAIVAFAFLYNSRLIEGTSLNIEFGSPVLADAALPAFGHVLHAYAYMTLIMLSAFCVLLRAGLVPSAPKRTALVTTAAGLPLILGPAFGLLSLMSPFDVPAAPRAVTAITLATLIWWLVVTAMATAISHVIYGLRLEVRAARKLGQYTLEHKLGEGGMGMVFRAQHALLRRPTAIKLILPDKAGRHAVERFEREVRLTARLSHPNTVTVYDYGRTPEGTFYYAMELLDGATLAQIVELKGPMPTGRVLHVMHAIAGALAEAHDVGLIHRDVKPANIFLARQGGAYDVPKILDFGLVKDLTAEQVSEVTERTSITGTPLYMAPEALTRPEHLDGRADLYALGCVGFYLLTGEHVFRGNSAVEILGHHIHSEPRRPSDFLSEALPDDVESLVLACLAKDPADRPASAHALADAIEACGAFGSWPRLARQQWWAEHGPEVVPARAEHATAGTRTIAVDLCSGR